MIVDPGEAASAVVDTKDVCGVAGDEVAGAASTCLGVAGNRALLPAGLPACVPSRGLGENLKPPAPVGGLPKVGPLGDAAKRGNIGTLGAVCSLDNGAVGADDAGPTKAPVGFWACSVHKPRLAASAIKDSGIFALICFRMFVVMLVFRRSLYALVCP